MMQQTMEIPNEDPKISRPDWRVVQLGEEWETTFRSFRESAFRLEVLQQYVSPIETVALNKFLQGETIAKDWLDEWCALVHAHKEEGRSMKRVHIVDLPLSDYVRFEIECAYVHTGVAGEDIFLLNRNEIPDHLKPHVMEDFWLFDENKVMVQDYESSGEFQQARMSTDSQTLQDYVKIRDVVLGLALPFREFYRKVTGKTI